jgi:hypothetical protein
MTNTCNSCFREWKQAPKGSCQRKAEHQTPDSTDPHTLFTVQTWFADGTQSHISGLTRLDVLTTLEGTLDNIQIIEFTVFPDSD